MNYYNRNAFNESSGKLHHVRSSSLSSANLVNRDLATPMVGFNEAALAAVQQNAEIKTNLQSIDQKLDKLDKFDLKVDMLERKQFHTEQLIPDLINSNMN